MTVEILDKLQEDKTEFGPYQEEAIISLALDFPDFFTSVSRYIRPEMFSKSSAQYVLAFILNSINEHNVVPTRGLLYDQIARSLKVDDNFEDVLNIVNRKSDPREIPILKNQLLQWTKNKAYGLLFNDESLMAYQRGDFEYLDDILSSANRIADVGDKGLWFFEQISSVFAEGANKHMTTGFHKLDAILNDGGPSPGEVVCYLAPTNVGKSIMLVNNAMSSIKGVNPETGEAGQDVLLVTFELDVIKTALRCIGVATGTPFGDMKNHQQYLIDSIQKMQDAYGKKLYIYELPPDECSVDHIYALLDNLKRTKGWKPDVVIIDYLELMVSRHAHYNKDEYLRQKHVATEVRGLAKNEHVLVFTATQTNRGGSDSEKMIELDKMAESFGKSMPLDYVISLNQSETDRVEIPARIVFFIAKNRNGPKMVQIECTIDYNTMQVKERL